MATIETIVRPGDCDSFGHVNNSVYVSHVQHALADSLSQLGYASDWTPEGGFAWTIRSLSIEYRQAALFGERLTAAIWLSEPHGTDPTFGCEIKRISTAEDERVQQSICRSLSKWRRIDRNTRAAVPLAESLLNGFEQQGGAVPRRLKLPSSQPQLRSYTSNHRVMRTDVDLSGRVHPQSVYPWIEESVFDASAQAGWPLQRWLELGFVTLQMRHDSEFHELPKAGETVQIENRLVEIRRFRGTWLNEISRAQDGALLIRNYSTGVFLNLEGRPASPPADMLRDIQLG